MEDNLIKVKDNKDLVEIQPDYVYMIIPSKWVCLYHKILVLLSDFGLEAFNDCSCGKLKSILTCWNIFQSALAANALKETEKAEKYIAAAKQILNCIYSKSDKSIYDGFALFPITENGELHAITTCDNDYPTFMVDGKTKDLYIEYLNNKQTNKVFTIKDNNLYNIK